MCINEARLQGLNSVNEATNEASRIYTVDDIYMLWVL